MNLELTGKTALVTGGSQGIGRAIAFGLAAEGARVAICARDKSRLEQTAQEVRAKTSAEVLVVPGDLSRLDEVDRVAATVKERFGRIDILINNAGAIRGGDFLKIPDEQWAGDWSLKILGYVRMARAVFPIMQAHGGGRIVNVVGAAARNPTPGYLPGGIANSGLINFSKGLRRPRRAVEHSRDRGLAGGDRDHALGELDRAAGRGRRDHRRGAARGGREPVSTQADRDAGRHFRSRVLPRIGARLVHHRCVHYSRRRRDAGGLPLILSVRFFRFPINLTCVNRCHISLRQHGVARK